jgi:hypothetical protein
MRDYAIRQQAGKSTPMLRGVELDALQRIAEVAGRPTPEITEGRDELRVILRSARANAHPDRNNGDRSTWDVVEQAARVLNLD